MTEMKHCAMVTLFDEELNIISESYLENDDEVMLEEAIDDLIENSGAHDFSASRFREMKCKVCGKNVNIAGWTNYCSECDTYYGSDGGMLKDPEYWGDETGENLADMFCVREEEWY